MNMSEELQRLDSPDLALSQRLAQRLISALNVSRDPELLNDLMDYHLQKQSKAALRVIMTLKDIHSQDFFAKLHDCLLKVGTRLKSLLLLAHMLNGQASWLYKTVDSPVFSVLLQFLRSTDDVILLSNTLHVISALVPLSAFHTSKHLPDLFEGFTRSATLKSVLVKLPRELFLGLDMAVFYFFLQLYALYPCKFLHYLKGRFGPTGEVETYTEHIAPLFRHVQLHPNLVTDLPSQEEQRTRWSSQDPHDVCTLALSLCTDPYLVPLEPSEVGVVTSTSSSHQGESSNLIGQLPCDPSLCGPLEDISILPPLDDATPPAPAHPPSRLSNHSSECLSGSSSLQTTPLTTPLEKRFFSYSPTASVEGPEATPYNSALDSSHKTVSPVSSGRTSPVKSAGNTPRSFRHIVSDIFRRSNNNMAANTAEENKEDFTNISTSELDGVIDVGSKSPLPSPPRRSRSPSRGLTISEWVSDTVPAVNEDTPVMLPMSLPDFKRGVANHAPFKGTRARMNSLQSGIETHVHLPSFAKTHRHGNSFITSFESLSTLTPVEEDTPTMLLVHRSVDSIGGNHDNGIVGVVSTPPSPAAVLDQYISNGNVLHKGCPRDLPLTDHPGTQWDHYGGCPHTEELRIKTGLSAVLQSQVLYERHQCQQHAKRNRRLMSKARSTAKLESEVLALRCRLLQQDELVVNLQSEQLVVNNGSGSHGDGNNAHSVQNRTFQQSNRELREEVQRLRESVRVLKEENKSLGQRLNTAASLENENEALKRKLKEVPRLQNQVETVLKEQLVIEELYHQQKVAVAAFRRENTSLQQTKKMFQTLTADNKGMSQQVTSLKQEVCRLKALLGEEREGNEGKRREIGELRKAMEQLQYQSNDELQKVKEQFESVKSANQQLEEKILQVLGTRHTNMHTKSTQYTLTQVDLAQK